MSQGSLFDDRDPNEAEVIQHAGADLIFYPRWLDAKEAAWLFRHCQSQLAWEQSHIVLYGKSTLIPRLNAWYGDVGSDYQYSGTRFTPLPFDAELDGLRLRLQALLQTPFNSVLANLYRDGHDSVSWHSDDEPELGREPVIASLSLGAERIFSLKNKKDKQQAPLHLGLPSGSLLVMKGRTQADCQHQLAKTTRDTGPRINLTFRRVNATQI